MLSTKHCSVHSLISVAEVRVQSKVQLGLRIVNLKEVTSQWPASSGQAIRLRKAEVDPSLLP